MLYVCGDGGWVDPRTAPEQPQDKAIEASIPVSKSACRTRKLSFRGRVGWLNRWLDDPSPMVPEAPSLPVDRVRVRGIWKYWLEGPFKYRY
jgi:hypothetical protein